jgi:S-adenosylhomocysteine hydrolase
MIRGINIDVVERIEVDELGNANCLRTYTLENLRTVETKIDSQITVSLDQNIEFVGAYLDDQVVSKILQNNEAWHTDIILFFPNRILAPRARTVLRIEYKWPSFLPQGQVLHHVTQINFMHEFDFSYELQLSCRDKGLLGDPAITVSPSDLREANRFSIRTENGDFVIRPRRIPPKQRVSVRIGVHAGGKPDLKLLLALGDEYRIKAPFRDTVVIFIQHLLNDFEALLFAFRQSGLKAENTFIIGIPYSTKQLVVDHLQAQYENVYTPGQYPNPFLGEVRVALAKAYNVCTQRSANFLVVEDGGYIADLLRNDPDGRLWSERCLGIVEQTRNGIKVTQEWSETQSPRAVDISVVNVAETALKRDDEAPLIGRAVVFNIRNLLKCYEHQDLPGISALLVGCGDIGSEIGKELIADGVNLTVVDNRARDQIRSFPEGASYAPLETLADLVAGKALIVGATGQGMRVPRADSRPPFLGSAVFSRMDGNVVLVNASSKMCEYDWDALRGIAPNRLTKRGFGHELMTQNGKTFRIAADGFPVNFYNSESAPADKIQPILGMLFLGACRILDVALHKGVNAFTDDDQKYISKLMGDLR